LGTGEGAIVLAGDVTIRPPNLITGAGDDNVAGADFYIKGALGRGTGDVGQIIFQTAQVAAADTVQTYETILTLDEDTTTFAKAVTFDATPVTFGGTSGTSWVTASGGLYGIDDKYLGFGTGIDVKVQYETADADAKIMLLTIDESDDSGNNVPVFVFGEETNVLNADLGLFDEVVQPHLVTIENSGQIASITNASSSGASVTLTTATGGTFTSATIGDIVRVVSGTNATAGWYWIDVATDGTNINLDRNWCTGAVSSDGVVQVWHKVGMLTPKAIYMPIYDGAPSDSDIDIDMDGATALDVGSETGLLYARMQNTWAHFTPDGGSPNFETLTIGAAEVLDVSDNTLDTNGDIAVTDPWHKLIPFGGVGSGNDDLVKATGGQIGQILVLSAKTTTSDSINQITVKNATGADKFNLAGGADFVLDHIDDKISLLHNGTEWDETSRSSNS